MKQYEYQPVGKKTGRNPGNIIWTGGPARGWSSACGSIWTTEGAPHAAVPRPAPARDLHQYWFDPEWRAANLHYRCPAVLSRPTFCRWPTPISAQARWLQFSAPSWKAARIRSGFTRAPETGRRHRPGRKQPVVAVAPRPDPRVQASRPGQLFRRLSRPDRGSRHAGRVARHTTCADGHRGPPRRAGATTAGGQRCLVSGV